MAHVKRRPSKSNRRGMLAIASVVMVLLVSLLVQSQKLEAQNLQWEESMVQLEQQMKDEELRAEKNQKLKENLNTPEYIEKIARDRLGLVYEDEIVFKAEE